MAEPLILVDWWQCVIEVLRPTLSSRGYQATVSTLQQFIDSTLTETLLSRAMQTRRRVTLVQRHQDVCVSVEPLAALARSLNMLVEVPVSANNGSQIIFYSTPDVEDTKLQYVARSLEGLMDMDRAVASELFDMTKEELHRLWMLLMRLSDPGDMEEFNSQKGGEDIRTLWSKNGVVLRYVGFVHKADPSPCIVHTGTDTALENYRTLRNFLHGVLENPGEESFV